MAEHLRLRIVRIFVSCRWNITMTMMIRLDSIAHEMLLFAMHDGIYITYTTCLMCFYLIFFLYSLVHASLAMSFSMI